MSIFDLFAQIAPKKPTGPVTHLVVGLGNPGKEYEWTRHNVGFMALDALAKDCGVSVTQAKFNALVADATVGEHRVLLMKPQTFMNLSGEAVGAAASFYKIPPEQIIVLSDDVSLDVGILRIRRKGSAGGHNGLKNITAHLNSDAYPRIKIGVGKNEYPNLVDWVLGAFPTSQRDAVLDAAARAAKAVTLLVQGKIDLAMNTYNG